MTERYRAEDAAVILGSSRSNGNTRAAVELTIGTRPVGIVDLAALDIGPYDYSHRNATDDFLQLIGELDQKLLWILATPVYWYAMSGRMKTFIDRFSDLVTIRREQGRSLRGKSVAVIASGTDARLPAGFEEPFRQTCGYLDMNYRGVLYVRYGDDGAPVSTTHHDAAAFAARLFTGPAAQPAAARTSGPSVHLERPSAARRPEFLVAVRRSRVLHGRFVTPPASATDYTAWLRRLRRATHEGHFVVDSATGELAGVVNVSEIVRGSFQSGYLGYYAFVPHAGSGRMSNGMRQVLRHAFGRLGLHRVEASIQPDNIASIGFVRRLGFAREGYSPRYLKIRGRWQDHERWAMTRENWRSSR